jgi:acyl-CoA hydrolase
VAGHPPVVSAADAVAGIRSGERVYLGCAAAEPRQLVAALVARAEALRDVAVIQAITLDEAAYAAPEMAASFRVTTFFLGSNTRAAVHEGRADFVPIFLSEVPGLFLERGRPVIALQSTARDGAVSRIVPVLSEGAGVVTSRGDVHWVVTEWGVADLFARGVHERAQALIDIAHPAFRDELRREAVARHLLRA